LQVNPSIFRNIARICWGAERTVKEVTLLLGTRVSFPFYDLKILNNVQSVQYPAHDMHCNMEKHLLFWHHFRYKCYSVVCTLYTWLECAYVWYMYKLLLAAQTMKFSAGCRARCFTFDAMLHETSSLPSDLGPSWPARQEIFQSTLWRASVITSWLRHSSMPQSTHEKLGK
jgi:hypothetical protein